MADPLLFELKNIRHGNHLTLSMLRRAITLASDQASFTAAVNSSIYPTVKFGLDVRIHKDGVSRVRMDEVGGLRTRYNEAASWALVSKPEISQDIQWTIGKKDVQAAYGPKEESLCPLSL